MRAITVENPGGPEALRLQEMPSPLPGPQEALVQVRAAGVNRADLLQRQGRYPAPAGASPVLGLEIAGILAQAAGGIPAGSRVMALVGGGGYAEEVVVPIPHLVPIPAHLSFEQAAAVPEAFLTAYHNLFDLGDLGAGQAVLIHAAASGVGTAAIQIARRAGARVMATSRSAEKLERCRGLGAEVLICAREGIFADRVLQETGGKGADLVLDFVGAPYWDENIRSLARGGKMALIGALGGAEVKINLGVFLQKRLRVEGSTLRGQTLEEKTGLIRRAAPMLLEGLEDGSLHPVLDQTFPLEQAAHAHHYMESNQGFGKIVLSITKGTV